VEKVKELKKLPTEFDKFGYHFTLVERTDTKAIYAQGFNGRILAFEIIKVEVVPEKHNTLFNKVEPAHEVYPRSSKWGEKGWTICDREKAMKKYHSL
jgi:hypothetical protein